MEKDQDEHTMIKVYIGLNLEVSGSDPAIVIFSLLTIFPFSHWFEGVVCFRTPQSVRAAWRTAHWPRHRAIPYSATLHHGLEAAKKVIK